MQKQATLAHVMDARKHPTEMGERVAPFQLRRLPTLQRKHREAESKSVVKGPIRKPQRSDDRQLGSLQFGTEFVFFQNRRIAPTLRAIELGETLRAIELGDDGGSVFDAHTEYPILETVERHDAPIGAQAKRLYSAKNRVGVKSFKRALACIP